VRGTGRNRAAGIPESDYPCICMIDRANRPLLGYWVRYLPSPGLSAAGHRGFGDAVAMESAALDLIQERFDSLGGWSPPTSKAADRMRERMTADAASH
jgi:hypothetical protein